MDSNLILDTAKTFKCKINSVIISFWTLEMTPQVKALAANVDDLSLVFRTHMIGEN